jgi:hypothetical protein
VSAKDRSAAVAADAFPPKNPRIQRVATTATIAFFAFILGFAPMWLTARARAGERDAAQQSLRRAQIENALAAAAILARLGDYEPARVAASAFFTDLQTEVDRPASGFTAASRGALQGILAERDAVITLLARGDAAAAERLATTYTAYRLAAGAGSPLPAG